MGSDLETRTHIKYGRICERTSSELNFHEIRKGKRNGVGGELGRDKMLPQFSFLSLTIMEQMGVKRCSSLRKIRVKWTLLSLSGGGHREVKIYKTMASGAGGLPWRAPTLC